MDSAIEEKQLELLWNFNRALLDAVIAFATTIASKDPFYLDNNVVQNLQDFESLRLLLDIIEREKNEQPKSKGSS